MNYIDIINEYEGEVSNLAIMKDFILYSVNKLDLKNVMFNVIIINNEQIHELNKTYRNVDRPTDVITFALEDGDSYRNPKIRLLGDIYLCVPVAYEQAQIYGHSKLREICFLATHGVLHLLGYDHMNEEEEKEMFSLQKELLNSYEITR